eukprot:gene9847-20481_t
MVICLDRPCHEKNSAIICVSGRIGIFSSLTVNLYTKLSRMLPLGAHLISSQAVQEDSKGVIKGKKLYVFWIIWPHDKNLGKSDDKADDDSDNEDTEHKEKDDTCVKHKDLKQIVESEVMTQRREQQLAVEQLERHQKHDSNVSSGMKIAAVAVGGVVVGALTAGIGLVPYITVVGLTAVAGGAGVLYSYRKPANSRLILACDSMNEALEWKKALESQLIDMEVQRGVNNNDVVDVVVDNNDDVDAIFIVYDIFVDINVVGIDDVDSSTDRQTRRDAETITPPLRRPPHHLRYPGSGGSVRLLLGVGLEGTGLCGRHADHGADTSPIRTTLSTGSGDNHPSTIPTYHHLLSRFVPFKNCFLTYTNCCPDITLHGMTDNCEKHSAIDIPGSDGSAVVRVASEGRGVLVQGVDDHADILGVSVHPDKTRGDTVCGGGGRGGLEILGRWRPPCPCPRMKLTLSRFWRLDDDGSYFIAMNSTSPPSSSSHPLSFPSTTTEEKKSKSKNKQGLTTVDNNVNVMIILTVAPRKDHSEFNDDLREALVTCAVQVQERDPNTSASTHSPSPSSPWSEELAEGIDAFMDSVVLQLVDLRQTLLLSENTNNNNHHPRHSHSHSDGNRTNDGIRRHEGDSNAKYSHSHTHLNNINDGKSSRTPGGGGGGSRGTGGGMSSATSPYDDSKSRSMALKKRLTTPGNTVTTTQPGSDGDDTHTSTTTSRRRGGGTETPPPARSDRGEGNYFSSPSSTRGQGQGQGRSLSRSRGEKINREASNIRNQINSKDFEVQRIEKMIRKGTGAGTGAGANSRELLAQMEVLLKEMKQLEDSYQQVTGQAHGANAQRTARGKGFLDMFSRSKSRLASSVDNSNNNTPVSSPHQSDAIESLETSDSSNTDQQQVGTAVPVPVPVFWDYDFQRKARRQSVTKGYGSSSGILRRIWCLLNTAFELPHAHNSKVITSAMVFLLTYMVSLALMNRLEWKRMGWDGWSG